MCFISQDCTEIRPCKGLLKSCWTGMNLFHVIPNSLMERADPCVPQHKPGVTPELRFAACSSPVSTASVALLSPQKNFKRSWPFAEPEKNPGQSSSSSASSSHLWDECILIHVWASWWRQGTQWLQTTFLCLLQIPSLIFKNYIAGCGFTICCALIFRTNLYWF